MHAVRTTLAGIVFLVSTGLSVAANADAIGRDAGFGRLVPTKTASIDHFQPGSGRTRFGALTFVGGFAITSSDPVFGGMSSLRVSTDRRSFLGVMDTGFWYSGRFERDDDGRLSGVSEFRIADIRGRGGEPTRTKWESDAESTVIRKDGVLVGFERDHRIDLYPLVDPQGARPIRSLKLPFPVSELRRNRGIETLAVSPSDGPLAGATVAVSEMSLNRAGDIYAGILDGPKRGTFFIKRDSALAISDGDFLPNGDLLLLERGVTLATVFQVRIVRIAGEDIRAGATVSGNVIFKAGFGDQIDNMEGLSVSRGPGGEVYLTLVSDDNNSALQRSIFLEFRLDDQNRKAAYGIVRAAE